MRQPRTRTPLVGHELASRELKSISSHTPFALNFGLMPGSTTNAAFSEYIYFDGKRAARRDYQSNVFYYFADQVGSARGMFEVASGSHTATPCFDADFYPFGGEHDFLNSCPQNYKFMGKERDPETNNDDFGARSYASAYGRFLSADWSSTPSPVPYANLTNPQTLNLYAMVSDNPESFADLDGHEEQIAQTNNACGGPGSANCTQNADAKTGGPAQTSTTVSTVGTITTIQKDGDLTTLTQKTVSTVTETDAKGNVVATGSQTTTNTVTVDGKGAVLGGTTQTTLRLNDSSGKDISPAAGAVQDLTPLRATQAVGPQQAKALQDSVEPSLGQRLRDHKVGIGGTALGGGIAIGCVLAEPCGAAVTVTGIGIATGSAIYDMLTH